MKKMGGSYFAWKFLISISNDLKKKKKNFLTEIYKAFFIWKYTWWGDIELWSNDTSVSLYPHIIWYFFIQLYKYKWEK